MKGKQQRDRDKSKRLCLTAYRRYYVRREFASAKALVLRALKADNGYYYAHFLMGLLLKSDDPSGAVACLRKCVELEPHYPRAWDELGWLFARDKDRLAESIDMFKQAHELDPSFVWTTLALANRTYAAGDIESSRGYYLEALALEPQNEACVESYQEFRRWLREKD